MEKSFVWDDNLVKELLGFEHDPTSVLSKIGQFKAKIQLRQEKARFAAITDAINQKPLDYEIIEYKDGSSIPASERGIKSVKRLSDNEVFNFGDECEEGKITGFDVRHHTIYVKTDKYIGTYHLSEIKKAEPKKQLLFTTADGIEIFEGDSFWFVYPQWVTGKVEKAISSMRGALDFFSTEEAARNYIVFNKPCLSLGDVLANTGLSAFSSIERLTNLAKSKNK